MGLEALDAVCRHFWANYRDQETKRLQTTVLHLRRRLRKKDRRIARLTEMLHAIEQLPFVMNERVQTAEALDSA
jgi:CII-binding regulator of phage lambda lysogenization HflD